MSALYSPVSLGRAPVLQAAVSLGSSLYTGKVPLTRKAGQNRPDYSQLLEGRDLMGTNFRPSALIPAYTSSTGTSFSHQTNLGQTGLAR